MKRRWGPMIAAFWLVMSVPFWVALPYTSYVLLAKRDSFTLFVGYKIRVWGTLQDFNDIWSYGYPTTSHWTSKAFGIIFTQVSDSTHTYWNLDLSPWPFCLGFSALAIAFIAPSALRFVRTRRGKAGVCRVCGYDLRASPTRCPECGTEVR